MNKERLSKIHSHALASYQSGCRDAKAIVPPEDCAFLSSIGLHPGIVFDYVEDYAKRNQPTPDDFLGVAAIRCTYFIKDQGGNSENDEVPEKELPLREEDLDGIPWLPRIIRKAQCFLNGTLSSQVMYGCSGDLAFLKKHGLNLVDFLTVVRDADGNLDAVLRYVRKS